MDFDCYTLLNWSSDFQSFVHFVISSALCCLELAIRIAIEIDQLFGLRCYFKVGRFIMLVFMPILVGSKQLASRCHHLLVFHCHRKLGMGIAMDWFRRFVSSFLCHQRHMGC